MSPFENTRCFHLADSCPGEVADGAGATCEACEAYARLLEPVLRAETTADRPLPAPLAARLRRLGDDFATPEHDPAAGMPLGSEATQAARDVLATTLVDHRRARPLPKALRRRLKAIPRQAGPAAAFGAADGQGHREPRTGLSPWLADGRYATAACALLTAFLTLAAGDASARFQETTSTVTTHTRTWKAQSRSTAEGVLARTRSGAAGWWDGGLAAVEGWTKEAEQAVSGLWQEISAPDPRTPSNVLGLLGIGEPDTEGTGPNALRNEPRGGEPGSEEQLPERWAEELRQLAEATARLFQSTVLEPLDVRSRNRPSPAVSPDEPSDPAQSTQKNPSSPQRDDFPEGSHP